MRNILFTLCILSFVSCRKDEKDEPIHLDQASISITHNGELQLTASEPCTWASADTNVAMVSNTGLVRGNFVGKTTITAVQKAGGARATCEVTVAPVSALYVEPYFSYKAPVDFVTMRETRELTNSSYTGLLYIGENNNVRFVLYLFNGGFLESADVMLRNSGEVENEAMIFLAERYSYIGEIDYHAYAFTGDHNMVAVLNYDATLGLNVLYFTSYDKTPKALNKRLIVTNRKL